MIDRIIIYLTMIILICLDNFRQKFRYDFFPFERWAVACSLKAEAYSQNVWVNILNSFICKWVRVRVEHSIVL